jgi:hypothetical protein
MRLVSRRTLVILMAVIALVVGVSGTAQAAARATHYYTTYLAWNPNPGMPVHCQPARVININEDDYTWGHFWGGVERDLKAFRLGTDTYVWADCLYPDEFGEYHHVSSLDPQNHPDWPTAYIESWNSFGPPDRNVTWGSYLDN